ncbi:MAG: hypothetical protein ACKVVP_14310 [Chloroflexota bacterium]
MEAGPGGATPLESPPLPPWDGIAPVALLDRVRRFNRAILNPVVRRFAGRAPGPLVLLWHRGRKSGRIYAVPLVAWRTSSAWIIPLTYGTRAEWVKNVLASGAARLRHCGQRYGLASPVIIDDLEALPQWPIIMRLIIRQVGIKRFMVLQSVSEHRGRNRPQCPSK